MNITPDICVEIFGVIAALIYVYLEIKQRRSMWVVGIVSSLVYVYVFYISKFYADMALSAYYALAGVYGMWCWRQGSGKIGHSAKLQVSQVKARTGVIFAVIAAVLFILIRTALIRYTDSPVPTGDALTTALSIVGTYMLARKILEHWLVWIVVNGVSVGLFYYKDLLPTAGLYFLYTALSFYGLFRWRGTMRKSADADAPNTA